MPTAITLKNIPDKVYERLKASAATHRRSLNQEAIACLEEVLLPQRTSVEEELAKARELRAKLPIGKFTAGDIKRAIAAGRP